MEATGYNVVTDKNHKKGQKNPSTKMLQISVHWLLRQRQTAIVTDNSCW